MAPVPSVPSPREEPVDQPAEQAEDPRGLAVLLGHLGALDPLRLTLHCQFLPALFIPLGRKRADQSPAAIILCDTITPAD
jgi:hypothetical protein